MQRKVKRVVVHKDYKAPTFENDIAILELENAIVRQPHIVPICMPESLQIEFEGKVGIVTGWGRTEYGKNHTFSSDNFMHVARDVSTAKKKKRTLSHFMS